MQMINELSNRKSRRAAFALLGSMLFLCLIHSVSAANKTADAIQSSFSFIPFEAQFVALRHGKDVGVASILLLQPIEQVDFRLIYESSVSRFFLSDKRKEVTDYRLTSASNLSPLSYHYTRWGTGPNQELKLRFDKQTNQIQIDENKTIEMNETIDNQLFRVDISKQLALGKQVFSYDFINYRGDKRNYVITKLQNESLQLPYGNLDTIKVEVSRNSNTRVTYAWFAPSLNFSLVRLQQFKEGKEQGDIQLSHFSFSN